MKRLQAYKFRLKTSSEIENVFQMIAGCCRKVWNMVLEHNLFHLAQKAAIWFYHEADFWLKLWKQSEEYGFLKLVPAQVLQQKLLDLDQAFRAAFDKNQPHKRMPTWRKMGKHDSFRFPQHFKIENRRIFLPKIGWVGFYQSQPIVGKAKNITVSKKGAHWYASILTEIEVPGVKAVATSAIGLDVGIKAFAVTSNGQIINGINSFKSYAAKLAKLQRQLAKKVKFSANWQKQKLKIQQLHQKMGHIRHDFLHKLSTTLCNNHAMIVVEDLKIKHMSRSAKGTLQCPGKHVKAKSGLNKAILDQGWGKFRLMLEYKLKWLGGLLLKVNAKHTSQRCHACGHIAKANRVSQSMFRCVVCNHEAHADINAANNILAAGHAVLACGETVQLGRSMKQEPLGISD